MGIGKDLFPDFGAYRERVEGLKPPERDSSFDLETRKRENRANALAISFAKWGSGETPGEAIKSGITHKIAGDKEIQGHQQAEFDRQYKDAMVDYDKRMNLIGKEFEYNIGKAKVRAEVDSSLLLASSKIVAAEIAAHSENQLKPAEALQEMGKMFKDLGVVANIQELISKSYPDFDEMPMAEQLEVYTAAISNVMGSAFAQAQNIRHMPTSAVQRN